jgi:hypothetical protein
VEQQALGGCCPVTDMTDAALKCSSPEASFAAPARTPPVRRPADRGGRCGQDNGIGGRAICGVHGRARLPTGILQGWSRGLR